MIFLGFQFFPPQASTSAHLVDDIYKFLLVVAAFFTILIAGLIIYFAVRYHRRFAKEKPTPIEGNHVLEALWVAIPLVILMVAFFWGAIVYYHLYRPPKTAIEMYAVGKQWMWKLQHPNGNREINELHVPVGQPVKLTITSEDVIHSFYVPAFRVKMDAIPGRYTTLWFEATKAGKYHLFCAEYCGTSHSLMNGSVIAMEPQDYERWLSGDEGGVVTMAERGAKLFREFRCNSCHTEESTILGPSLAGVFGSTVDLTTGQQVRADEAYIRESILIPSKRLVKGYQPVMPTFKDQLSEEQLLQIITYIKSLSEHDES